METMMSAMSWKTQAKERQQEVCELVIDYDWELYKKSEREFLERKVKYILFGPIENALDPETKLIIQKICAKILEEGNRGQCSKDETCMAFVYVFWTEKEEELKSWPVFKVPNDKSGVDSSFIDINARVYSSWTDFLENNQFPPCEYCYPLGGRYTTDSEGTVVIEFGKSPATRLSKSVIQCLDYANAGLAVGTTAIAAASLFVPVAGPLLQASLWLTRGICAYTTMRSGSTLIDRGTHKQSLGLHDGESRNCWLSIGGSVMGVASSSATTVTAKMAQSGKVMGRFGCATVTALNVGNVAVNGLGLLNSFHLLIDKLNKDQLTSLDVFQFSASLLLFAHAAVNVQTAKSIIENTQNGVLQEFENNLRSNRHRKMFRKVARNTKYEKNTIEGNAQVIRSLKHINNVDDFFSALVRMDKQFRPTQSRATFTEGGIITVNENLSIDPIQLVQATPDQRVQILEATKKYAGNQISEAEFKSMTESIIGKSPTAFVQQDSQLLKIASLKELLGLENTRGKSVQKIGSKFSYPLLNAYERMELMTMLKKFAESDHERILQIASTLLKALGWTSGLQYVEVAYFVCGLIRSIASNNKVGKDAEISESLVEEFRKDYFAESSDEMVEKNTELKYTEQHPLVINRSFWVKGELNLLSEEEILDVCRQSLCTELWPTDCNIDHDGSNIFVNIDEKLVVIQCNFEEDKLSAYIAVAASL
ncbi:Uncharacterized protein GBIM_17240 [Gryllus bimaculatus]|nr:Uncharacterized protein GBIM_17240 [Gryllus bimaculatus]